MSPLYYDKRKMGYNLDIKKISKEEWNKSNCKEYALFILSKYSKTEKQLRDKLKQCKKKYSDDTIDETIKFLKKHNYLNDEEFAKRFLETHKNSYSKKVIKEKLYQKGIERKIREKLYESENIEFEENDLIKKLLLKKCPDYFEKSKTMDMKERQKILAYLYRKGFNYEDIADVMKCNS